LARARRAVAALGEEMPFILVYYGSDGSGGWQPLTRPLRTVTTIDRFALVEHGDHELEMRMLQVSELRRAMGFNEGFTLSFGTRCDKIRLLGNSVCPPVRRQ
jgi:DNA (cytosine-5)-methyltransferase 1